VVVSLLYMLFRRALAMASLRLRSREFKELEIVLLRHELAVLRRQISRPRLDERDRVFLAAAGQLLGRASRSFFVRPDTLLGWHRQLVRRRWTSARRRPGRPAIAEEIGELVLRLARENPRWGYERIVGELAGVGVRVSATTVAKILRQAGVSPAGARTQLSWRDFLRAHADSIIACDFSPSRRSGSDASTCSSSLSSAAGGCTSQVARRTLTGAGPPSRRGSLPGHSPSGRHRPGSRSTTATVNSRARSMRSFAARASRSSAPRFVRRRQTRSPNAGSAPSAATASTGS
jgi:transposase